MSFGSCGRQTREGWPKLSVSENPACLVHPLSPLAGQTYSQGWSAAIAKHDQGVYVTGDKEGVTIRN